MSRCRGGSGRRRGHRRGPGGAGRCRRRGGGGGLRCGAASGSTRCCSGGSGSCGAPAQRLLIAHRDEVGRLEALSEEVSGQRLHLSDLHLEALIGDRDHHDALCLPRDAHVLQIGRVHAWSAAERLRAARQVVDAHVRASPARTAHIQSGEIGVVVRAHEVVTLAGGVRVGVDLA